MRLDYEKDRMWKGAIYGRVSTEKDSQKTSNENQISLLEEWIKSQKNIELIDAYLDESSGTKLKNRNGFLRMLKDAKDGRIDFIIVKSVTRFARNQVDSIKLAKELSESNVRIYFYQEQIDTFNDIQMLGLWSWLAEIESRNTSERRTIGGRESQKRGRFTTPRPPIGYKSVDKKLVVDDSESHIVKRMFDLYIEGNGYGKIASILNDEGYTTRRGRLFRSDKIKYILLNEVYKGTFIGNRYTKVDMLSDKMIEKPKSEWVILEENHEAIIEPELFDKVQSLINDKSFTVGKRSVALFAGVMKCKKCGMNMNRNTVKKKLKDGTIKKYNSYLCVGKTQFGKSYCNSSNVSENVFIDILNNELKNLQINPETIEKIKNETVQKINAKLKNMNSESENIENKIEKISKDRQELTKKYIAGFIADDMYTQIDAEYKQELKKLEETRTKNKVLDISKSFNQNYNEFINVLNNFKNIEDLTNVEVRRLIESIHVGETDIVVNFKINQSNFELDTMESFNEMIQTSDSDVKDLLYMPIKDTNSVVAVVDDGLNNDSIVSTINTKFKLKHNLQVYLKIA